MENLRIKGEFDFENYVKCQQNDYVFCSKPLFHGTRQYAIEVCPKKRLEFVDACYKIALFAKKLILEKKIEYNIVIMQVGVNTAFEYGDLYLIDTYTTAISYANNVAGELGKNVFLVCKNIKQARISLDDTMQGLIDSVMQEYVNYEASEKIVLVYQNVEFTDLYTIGGSSFIDPDDEEDMRFMIDDLYYEKEKLGRFPNTSFRLKNVEKYEAYIIREADLRKGFKAFTEVDDIDEHLKREKLNFISRK